MAKFFFIFSFFALLQSVVFCQKKFKDTLFVTNDTIKQKGPIINSAAKKDTLAKKKHDPTKGTLYSTVFPGLGQIYNKKYWKLPIVYAAVGIPAYSFFFNRTWYNRTRFALGTIVNGTYTDTSVLKKINSELRNLIFSNGVLRYDSANIASSLIEIRDEYRKDEDYSLLFFLLFYALQIVDATVDAHLKDFNVSSDLSLRIKPTLISGPSGTGLSLVLDIHKPKPKALFDTR